MHNQEFNKLLVKKLSGEASTEELKRLESQQLANNINDLDIQLIESAWNETKTQSHVSNQDRIFEQISHRIDSFDGHVKEIPWRQRSLRLMGIAASVILILATSALLWDQNILTSLQSQAVQAQNIITKSNPKGQKLKIHLPDASTVILNSESTISYPERFDASNRTVELTGEAFFDVTKDKTRPFTVVTSNISTTALGTSFNVKAFENEEQIEVDLVTGKVLVNQKTPGNKLVTEDFILTPGQGIIYHKINNQVEQIDFNPEEKTGWKEGLIYFKKSSKEQVFTELSRWYGVEFQFTNESDSWSYTGSFDNENMIAVLNSISFTKNFSYSIDGDIIQITFNHK